jgi:hypothetical protein
LISAPIKPASRPNTFPIYTMLKIRYAIK